MPESPSPAALSIAIRLQRVTVEETFISVPITDDLIREMADGSKQLNGAAVMKKAVVMAESPKAIWKPETQHVQPHPVQQSPYEKAEHPQHSEQPEPADPDN